MNICAFSFSCCLSTESTNQYLHRWDDGRWVLVTVVYNKRRGGGAEQGGAGQGGGPRLLHHVLDPREGLLYGPSGVHAACLLGQLQNRHVAQRTHFPHLQPLDEAPGAQAGRTEGWRWEPRIGKQKLFFFYYFTSGIISAKTFHVYPFTEKQKLSWFVHQRAALFKFTKCPTWRISSVPLPE